MIIGKRLFFLVIFVSCLLALAPSVIFADGGNPTPPAGEYKYVPPPYMGNVTVTYVDSCDGGSYYPCALLSGTLKRAGSDSEQINLANAIYAVGFDPDDFDEHTPKDLQGRQINGPEIGVGGTYEIIAAHSLFYNWNYTLFTVDVIVMEITPK